MIVEFDYSFCEYDARRINAYFQRHEFRRKCNKAVVSVYDFSPRRGKFLILKCLFYKAKTVKCAVLFRVPWTEPIDVLEQIDYPPNPYRDSWEYRKR